MAGSIPAMPTPPTKAWAVAVARFIGDARGQAGLGDALASYIEADDSDPADPETWKKWAKTASYIEGDAEDWGTKIGATYVSAASTLVDVAERDALSSWWGQLKGTLAATGEDVAKGASAAKGALNILKSPLGWLGAAGVGLLILGRRS